jgi:hypothetical protein
MKRMKISRTRIHNIANCTNFQILLHDTVESDNCTLVFCFFGFLRWFLRETDFQAYGHFH